MEKKWAGSTKRNGVQEKTCGEKSDRKYICSSEFLQVPECVFCGQNEDTNLFFG